MRGNEYQKKAAKTWLTAGMLLAVALIMIFSVTESALCGSQNDPEAEAVMQVARDYLDAEVRGDYPAVYASFAPSSDYARSNSFEQYLASVRSAQDRVVK